MDQMIVFENLMDIDDRGIQLLLREMQSDTLIIALKGRGGGIARKDIQEHVEARLRNDARRPGSQGSGEGREVEAQQKQILQIVRRLADEGQIVFGGKNEESYV